MPEFINHYFCLSVEARTSVRTADLMSFGSSDHAATISARSSDISLAFCDVSPTPFLEFFCKLVCKLLFGVSVSSCFCWSCDFAATD